MSNFVADLLLICHMAFILLAILRLALMLFYLF